jgi:uncharacterized protein YndB with AHSA1/START domain
MTTATSENIKLKIEKLIKAPRERVFKAWTDPKQIQQWFVACGKEGEVTTPSVKCDPRVGGKFRIQTLKAGGEYFTAAGTYREVKPLEKLVFTWAWEKDGSGDEYGEIEPDETLVTVELLAKGNDTLLVFTHEKFASVESRDRHQEGWTRILENFQKQF